MATQDVINCAPFRLAQPRSLTPFEWTVVEEAIRSGIMLRVGLGGQQVEYDAKALTSAISVQRNCPNWASSVFGPAPAVSRYAYMCLGNWFGGLDQVSKGRVIYDIGATGLLCSAAPPWAASCALSRYETPKNLWEGSEQRGRLVAGTEACAWTRIRTTYAPMTGQEMAGLFGRVLGGQLPPILAQGIQMPGFGDRSFLIGVQLRDAVPNLMQTIATGNLLSAFDAMVEDVVLIWAPGKGISVKQSVLTGQVDFGALMTVINDMLPQAIGPWLQQLPGILGQVLPGLIPGGVLPGTQRQFVGSSATEPRTSESSGLPITDQPGSELPTSDPFTGPSPSTGDASKAPYYIGAALIGIAALAWLFSRRGS